MRCSVVIPCHDGADLTRACLHSLFAMQGAAELEILLVDNGSSDGTPELAAVDPRVTVLRQGRNLGFPAGVNVGVRAAKHPLLLVLNNDTQAATNLLVELEQALDLDPRVAAAAPVSNDVKGRAQIAVGDAGRSDAGRSRIAAALAHGPRWQDAETLAGLCLLLRRDALDEVGLFDERFGHGNFEDDDLCLRLRLAGRRLLIARRAPLHHEGHATFRALGLGIAEQIDERRAQFVAKWQHDPAGRATIAALGDDVAAAATAAEAARRRWPEWPDADWHRARGCLAAGQDERAAVHLRALLRTCPHHGEAALALGILRLKAGDAGAAWRLLAWASEHCHLEAERLPSLLRALGEVADLGGRFADAAACFAAAAELAPGDGGLHNRLGASRLAAGDVDAAASAFARAAELGLPQALGG
ncbi:MAG: glycosyltransferase family 2 protein, partial [Planctomycetes bacterium]|nr:glycosyltransferase family 2 protein [Planctomycetota bacterium]